MFKGKKLIIITLAALLIMTVAVPAFAGYDYNLTVVINKMPVYFPDQEPFIDTDTSRTYVPLRFVSEELGGSVDWDGVNQTATVERNGKSIKMKIGSKKPTVNGQAKSLDAPARLMNGRTMVPLRFVSEVLGAEVKWDGKERIVFITDTSVPEGNKNNFQGEVNYTGSLEDEYVFVNGTKKVVFPKDMPIEERKRQIQKIAKDIDSGVLTPGGTVVILPSSGGFTNNTPADDTEWPTVQ